MAYKKVPKATIKDSIKVLITPWEKGFTCGIIMDHQTKMTTEQYE